MSTAVVTTKAQAIDRLNEMMRDVQAKRQELGRLAEAHGLDADRWGRADEAAGEFDSSLTDLASDLEETA